MRRFCAELSPEDGSDPRDWPKLDRVAEPRAVDRKPMQQLDRVAGPRAADRKTMQLCAQAAETLSYLLSEYDVDLLRVDPAPDASRLLVTVRSANPRANPDRILETLSRASLELREEVAASITRKRAPSLTFRVLFEADPSNVPE